MLWFFLLLGFGILSLVFVVWASLRRRRNIPALVKARLKQRWEGVLAMTDPALRVLEAEKVCDALLRALDYQGTFAEKLTAAAPRLSHVEDLWSAHRFRNRIAHEMNCHVTDRQCRRAVQSFSTLVHRFLP